MSIKIHPSFAIHAGEWLKTEIVEANGFNVKELAGHLHVSRQNLSNVLNGHTALTADMAIRFEKAFGVKADTLMRMQTRHELAKARQRESDLVVKRLTAAA